MKKTRKISKENNIFNLNVSIHVLSFIILLFGCFIALAIFLNNHGLISVVSVILLLIAVGLLLSLYLYKRVLKPLTELIKALMIIDFESDIVDFTEVDNLQESGLFEIKLLIIKFKYLLDIIEERINQYNSETSKSEHDELTGCYNRTRLNRVKTRYESQPSVFIIFIDVNNLKKMNDIFGHEAGDTLLQNAAKALKFWNSYGDVYRLGGDEFMIVLSNKKVEFCNRLLREWYPTVGILNRVSDGFRCVLSYGVAHGKAGCNFDELQKLADDRMYEMKVEIKKKFGEPMR